MSGFGSGGGFAPGSTTDETTEGRIPIKRGGKFVDSPLSKDLLIEEVLSDEAIRVPAGTLYIGPQLGLDDIGGVLGFKNEKDDIRRIVITNDFDASGSVAHPRDAYFNAKVIRQILQHDDTGQVTTGFFENVFNLDTNAIRDKFYFKIGTTPPVDNVTITVYAGDVDTKNLLFTKTYQPGDFSASSEFSDSLMPPVGQLKGQVARVVITSATAFSIVTDVTNTTLWLAFDLTEFELTNITSYPAWEEKTYAIGDKVWENRDIYECITAGTQTGSFNDNLTSWSAHKATCNTVNFANAAKITEQYPTKDFYFAF